MADEPTHTETSTTEAPTTEATSETVTENSTQAEGSIEQAADDDLSTALGGDAEATDEGKEGETEGAEAKADVPEAYELTPPEGFEKLDDTIVAEATPILKDLGLSNEQANKLMPIAGKLAQKIVSDRDAALMGTIMEQRKDWLETAKKDPEIGGANWDASIGGAAKAMDQMGFVKGSPLRAMLNETGLGNHPEMIRFMAKVGKAIGEDTDFARSTTGGEKKTDAQIFYPNMNGPTG